MKKYLYLIPGVIALAKLISSFAWNKETDEILWIEMNIWVYRLIYGMVMILMFGSYFSLKKAEKKSE